MSMIEDKRLCPHCGHQLHRKPYLMAVDPDAPGLIGILKGERGSSWRVAVTVALCVLAVLCLTAIEQVLA